MISAWGSPLSDVVRRASIHFGRPCSGSWFGVMIKPSRISPVSAVRCCHASLTIEREVRMRTLDLFGNLLFASRDILFPPGGAK